MYAQKAIGKANQVKLVADKEKCLDYLMALYESVNSGVYEKDKSISVLEHAESVSKAAVSLYLDATTLAVNSYEKMPYCYLITAYTMMCKMHLLNSDYDAAYAGFFFLKTDRRVARKELRACLFYISIYIRVN